MTSAKTSLTTVIIFCMIGAAIMLQFSYSSSLSFNEPEIVQVAMRGPDGASVDPVYSEAQLTELHAALSAALMESYDAVKQGGGFKLFKKADYAIDVRMQEIFGGNLMLAITATAPGSDIPAKTWEKVLTSDQDLSNEITRFASEVGTELSNL